MNLFLERVGDDMENIRMELEKLISYTMGSEVVTAEDVKVITTVQITNKIFDMVAAITAGKTKRAMDLYEDLLTLREPPMRILFLIARQFNQLLLVRELQASRRRPGDGCLEIESTSVRSRKTQQPGGGIYERTAHFLCADLRGCRGGSQDRADGRPAGGGAADQSAQKFRALILKGSASIRISGSSAGPGWKRSNKKPLFCHTHRIMVF